jgi:hypothetical protein
MVKNYSNKEYVTRGCDENLRKRKNQIVNELHKLAKKGEEDKIEKVAKTLEL